MLLIIQKVSKDFPQQFGKKKWKINININSKKKEKDENERDTNKKTQKGFSFGGNDDMM